MASTIYTPLNSARKEIRLVRVAPSQNLSERPNCTLEVVSLESQPEFDAISYVWGDPLITKPIILNETNWQITTNLEAGLRHFRDPIREKRLWADAICINQSDLAERSAQVLLMGDVYSKADIVHIWLGEASDGSDEAIAMFEELSKGTPLYDIQLQGLPLTAENLKSMVDLLGRPWWRRIWVQQEAGLARFPVLHCGLKHVPLHEVILYGRKFDNASTGILKERSNGRFDELIIEELQSQMHRCVTILDMSRIAGGDDLDSFLLIFALGRLHEASVPRDKLYGLLGFMPQPYQELIEPDYWSPLPEVSQRATFQIMKNMSSLAVWSLIFPRVADDVTWPTWVVDWSAFPTINAFASALQCLRFQPFFQASGEKKMSLGLLGTRTLELAGLLIDTVAHLGIPFTYTYQDVTDLIAEWQNMCGQISKRQGNVRYIGGGTVNEASWRTILGNLIQDGLGSDIRPCVSDDFSRYQRFLQDMGTTNGRYEGFDIYEGFGDSLIRALFERRTMITEKGYMGVVPLDTKVGDLIYVLAGGQVPYLLRPSHTAPRPNTYTFVGPCYVHGIMYGEALAGAAKLDDRDLRQRRFEDVYIE